MAENVDLMLSGKKRQIKKITRSLTRLRNPHYLCVQNLLIFGPSFQKLIDLK
jgi:hypothetical protein